MNKYLNFLVVILAVYINTNSHIYKFVDYNTWLNTMGDKYSNIYLINDVNYCVISNQGIINNEYICTQNIIPIQNYLNMTQHKITQIIPTKHKYSYWSVMLWSWYLYIGLYIIYKYIIDWIKQRIFTKSQTLSKENNEIAANNESSTKSTSFFGGSFDSLYGGMYSGLMGNSNNVEVKSQLDPTITIDNFIGCNNIKKDINKIINQIKYNDVYKLSECELPKGLLLIGNPGCGKTHLVKTIINATGMNYIFTTGSDMNKIFVGSGSSQIGQIFQKARANKPCLIFFDEADTLLKKRTHSESTTSSTEFGSTICKLLSEMDSLKTESGVIVIFATNMNVDFVDGGILRAGRVDQVIHIDNPTFEERIDLFKMYLGKLLNEQINLDAVSKLSYGLTGSDIKKIINCIKINKVNEYLESNQDKIESKGQKYIIKNDENIPIIITTEDIDKEISKCILGLERDRNVNPINKKIIAYHEAGHAIMACLIKNSTIPNKICISINSKSLGYTMFPQDDDDLLMKTSVSQLFIEIMILYSGRMSEKIFMNEITCGAEDDYKKARKILKRLMLGGMLVPEYNLLEYDNTGNASFNTKMPEYIEKEIFQLNKIILEQVEKLLRDNSDIIIDTANKIIEYGSITYDDIDVIFAQNNKKEYIGSYDIGNLYKIMEDKILNVQ